MTRMWTKHLNNVAKLAWVGLLVGGVALYAYQQRRSFDSPPSFRDLSEGDAEKAWAGGQAIGGGEADIVVFSRYTCPYSQELLVRLGGLELGDGRPPTIRIRHLVHPMDSASHRAALGMVCADLHDLASEFHGALLQDASEKQFGDLIAVAERIGIADLLRFGACLGSDEAAKSVRADFQDGMELGITGVPALIARGRLVVGSVTDDEVREWLR